MTLFMRDVDLALEFAMKAHQVVVGIEMAKKVAAVEKVLLKKARRRAQSKLNQRRYRAEQKNMITHLGQAVHDLRTDVARMEGRVESMRLAISPALRTFEPECKVSKAYIHLFAHGYNLDPSTAEHKTQFDYLTSAMSPDLVIMGTWGLSKLFEQWVLYMNTFDSFAMELHSMHVATFEPNVIVHLDTTLHLRMSRKSIVMLFSHLVANEPLIQRLIGKVLHMPAQQHLVFDHNGVVQELRTHADTTSALVNVLGNLDDTLAVLGDFQLTEAAELVARDG